MDKIHVIALFAAISVYLSSIEYLLPRPVPFFRFGLANIALLLIIRQFNFRDTCVLVLLKVCGLGILNGTIASYVFLFSLIGSFSSLCVMKICVHSSIKAFSLVGVSIIGAFVSNVLQTLLAVVFIFGKQAWIIAPYLLSLGIISGVVVGVFAQYYHHKSNILPVLLDIYTQQTQKNYVFFSLHKHNYSKQEKQAFILLLIGLFTGVFYALTTSLVARALQVALFFLCAVRMRRIKVLYFLSLVISVTFFYMLIPNGRVLFNLNLVWFSFPITQNALVNGFFKSLSLCGYVFLSLWCIRSNLYIPGKIGQVFSLMLGYFYRFWNWTQPSNSKSNRDKDVNNEKKISIMMKLDVLLLKITQRDIEKADSQGKIPWKLVALSAIITLLTKITEIVY